MRAENWPWSSAAGHCRPAADDLLSGHLEQAAFVGTWRPWLLDEDDQAVRLLREPTRTRRPRGQAQLVQQEMGSDLEMGSEKAPG